MPKTLHIPTNRAIQLSVFYPLCAGYFEEKLHSTKDGVGNRSSLLQGN